VDVHAAGIVALAALVVVVASLGYLHVAPTGLSPLRNAVSQYGITSYKLGYRVATLAFALAGAALALGLDRALRPHEHGTFVIAMLVIFTCARAAISWFPMDAPGTPRTQTGRTHGLLAIAAFGAAAFAALRLGTDLSHATHWHSLAPVSTVLGWAMIVALVAMALARSSPAVAARFGAIERCFYVLAIVWFAVFAVACAG
jgi:hypothetical protein